MSAAGSSSFDRAQPHRLSGGLIDRSQRLRARFDGTEISAFAGDTLASALLANGVRLVGRSFKYHRPRGIFTAGPEEPNALVELRGGARREPNTRATTIEMYDGLEATSQNRWPSLRFDLLSVNSLLAPFFPAGFYYKTFMWPPSFWERVYEPMIRSRRGTWPRRRRARPRSLRASLRVLRHIDHRRRTCRARGRAKRGAVRRPRHCVRAGFCHRRAPAG